MHLTLLSRLPTGRDARASSRREAHGSARPAKRAAAAAPAKAAKKAAAPARKRVAAKAAKATKAPAKKATKRAAKATRSGAAAGRVSGSRRDQQQRIAAARDWARAQGRVDCRQGPAAGRPARGVRARVALIQTQRLEVGPTTFRRPRLSRCSRPCGGRRRGVHDAVAVPEQCAEGDRAGLRAAHRDRRSRRPTMMPAIVTPARVGSRRGSCSPPIAPRPRTRNWLSLALIGAVTVEVGRARRGDGGAVAEVLQLISAGRTRRRPRPSPRPPAARSGTDRESAAPSTPGHRLRCGAATLGSLHGPVVVDVDDILADGGHRRARQNARHTRQRERTFDADREHRARVPGARRSAPSRNSRRPPRSAGRPVR